MVPRGSWFRAGRRPRLQVQCSLEDAQVLVGHDGPVSPRAAHEYLEWWRYYLAPGGPPEYWARELTFDLEFEWQRYLGSLAQAESIIAGGVVGFWVVVLNRVDNRVDFVVRLACAATPGVDLQRVQNWRIDAVRLHPGPTGHGTPVFGRLADWVTPETLEHHFPDAAGRWHTPGDVVQVFREFRVYVEGECPLLRQTSPTEFPSRFLSDALAEWNARPHPRGTFARELQDEQPPPFRFDLALPSCYRSRGIVKVWLVWDPGREVPGLIFRMGDRSTIRATGNGGQLFITDRVDENSVDWR